MRWIRLTALLLSVAAAAILPAGCGGASSSSSLPGTQGGPPPANKIRHIVIIVQENRSFNDLFYDFPGAHTVGYGYDSGGRKIGLQPIGLQTTWDLDHSSSSFFSACNGKGSFPGTDCLMNGFNNEYVACGHESYPPCPIKYPPYAYVPHYETKPYFEMARAYVLADRMFTSNFDASSFISHQYIIAGQAESAVNYPDSAWGCEGGKGDLIGTVTQQRTLYGGYIRACFDDTTLGEELDKAGLPWAFYAASYSSGYLSIWSAYQANQHVYYGPDWEKDVKPNTEFFDDVANGRLGAVSWITPTCANSDHAGCGSDTGPSWVASLVNAVGESQYWNSTAIFIFWDDYGGWYDDVPPPLVDYDGLGIRVPLLVVSPYAKRDYVSHIQYEHGSILKFIEDRFGLPRMAASDTRANSPEQDCFDFNQAPRAFVPIKAPHDEAYFRHQPPDRRVPDSE
jgi:phospholipase C